MRTLIISTFALSTLLAGCFELGDLSKGTDTAGDTASDTAGDTSSENFGTASIRFINVVDGIQADFSFDAVDGAETPATDALYFTQGSAYTDVAATTWTVNLTDGLGGSASDSLSVTLEDGKHYTLAAMRVVGSPDQSELVLLNDDTSSDTAVAADSTRLRILPARGFDGMYAGQVYYNWGSTSQEWYEKCGYMDAGTLQIDAGSSESCEYPFAAASIYLLGQWGVPTTEPMVAQEIDAYIQVGNGTLVNVFLTCEGDCSADKAFILGQFEDGSTATTTSTVL